MAPALHHVGPLDSLIVQREALRRADQLAVHHPRGQRIDFARHQQRRNVVEQAQPLVESTVKDHESGEGHPADNDCWSDPESGAEIDRDFGLLAS